MRAARRKECNLKGWILALPAQAPACSIGELARAVIADAPAMACHQSIADSAKVDKSHSERNAHRLFNRWGLALRVPISFMEVASESSGDTISIPHLRLSDYVKLLAAKYPQVLMGGLDFDEGQSLCKSFWQRYQTYHAEHAVF